MIDHNAGIYMSRSAIIYRKGEGESDDPIGIYMGYDAPPYWVCSILMYMKMRDYCSPAINGIGMARLIQVISNYESTDQWGVMVDRPRALPDCSYAYEIDGWELSDKCKAEYADILSHYDLERFIVEVDSRQPYSDRLGEGLIHMFYTRGETLRSLHVDYYREMYEREDDVEIEQFQESLSYSTYGKTIRVLRRADTMMTVDYEGEIVDVPVYRWRDGSESTVIIDMKKRKKYAIMSIPAVESELGKALRSFHEGTKFEEPDVAFDDE